jgi:arylsulfatase A-like enzyme/Tfp pilus assembly protein PilF
MVAILAAGTGLGWWTLSRGVILPNDGWGSRTSPNLLLVTLDTTRADRLGPYGYSGVPTPVLDRLAAEGVVFDRAITAAPLTLPAHTSIMSGLYPPRHGVRDNGGFFVPDDTVTLAERLREQGYRTGAFVGAYVLDGRWGLNQGFDTYHDRFDLSRFDTPSLSAVERPGNEVADHALAWLGETATPPFFAWVHFFDPHSPYRAPEPYGRLYERQPYLGEIAFTDAQIGRIIALLEQRRLLDNTVVVVVGDHGESLGEHGEGTHGFFLYEATTRVPLIIRPARSSASTKRVDTVVRTVDVMPTVLELLGFDSGAAVDGRSLMPLIRGTARDLGLSAYSEALYPRLHFGWSELLAMHVDSTKYIAAPRPEVYDLAADPVEALNLYESRRTESGQVLESLRALARGAVEAVPTPAAMDIDTRRRLTALGYVASAPAVAANDTDLPDPKDKVELFTMITRAQELVQQRSNDNVVAILEAVIAKDPSVIDAWLMMGNEFSRRRSFGEAVSHYQKALALKPDYDLAVIGLARAYRGLGRAADAALGYRRFLERDPANAEVRFELAQVLLDAGDSAAAESELATVAQVAPGLARARQALGALRLERGDLGEAERQIRAALEAQPDVPMAHFHLALIAERQGRDDVAEAEYRKELTLFPANHMAHFNLGKVFERRGNWTAQLAAFRKAIEAEPRFAEGHLFLAKLLLDLQLNPADAIASARRGLSLEPGGAYAPLGHYLAAEGLNRQGRTADALREMERGRTLEARRASGRAGPPSRQ